MNKLGILSEMMKCLFVHILSLKKFGILEKKQYICIVTISYIK